MTRTQWAVVVGLLAFILAVFGVLLYQLQVPSPLPTPALPAFLPDDGAQARSVYPIAAQEALRWQEDAQLFSVGIIWDDLGPGGVPKRDRWTFEFFSPSQGQMAVIRATDAQAERLRTARLPNRLQVLPLDQWLVDSTQALQTWWEQGGGDFVRQHTRVSIGLKLRMEPKGTRSLWTVAASASDQHWVVRIDSRDGTVVE
jgi:hypothetical protein